MNRDQIEGNLNRLAGQLKAQWDKLTDDDVGRLDSTKDRLVGLLQSLYGASKDEAGRQAGTLRSALGQVTERADEEATRAAGAAGDRTRDVVDSLGSRAERLAYEAGRAAEQAARPGRGAFKNMLLLATVGILIGMYFAPDPPEQ